MLADINAHSIVRTTVLKTQWSQDKPQFACIFFRMLSERVYMSVISHVCACVCVYISIYINIEKETHDVKSSFAKTDIHKSH